jgi:AAA family ATP:ADP antiporter
VRDEMGVRSGVKNLPWLFTATFLVTLAIMPVFAVVVAWWKRKTFIQITYGFLIINILAFWVMLTGNIADAATAMTFFVWLSVFSVFAVSVFWSFMADVFSSEQAKRLFPIIAAGGSFGGFAGSATVTGLARLIGPANLLLAAAALLLCALICAMLLDESATQTKTPTDTVANEDQRVGGGVLAGLVLLVRSPYLLGIAMWVLLLSLAGTFAYNMQADILGRSHLDSASRTQIFGFIDIATNILNPLLQLTVSGWLLKRFGTGPMLSVIAVVFAIGFAALFIAPVLSVLIVFQIAQRTGQFGLSNPARQTLFTVLSREEKYKAKNVIDNVVFRGSDVVIAWLFNLMHTSMGLGLSMISLIAAPIMILWMGLSLALGHAERQKAPKSPHTKGDLA